MLECTDLAVLRLTRVVFRAAGSDRCRVLWGMPKSPPAATCFDFLFCIKQSRLHRRVDCNGGNPCSSCASLMLTVFQA